MSVDFNFPYLISENTPATAIEVQGNFDALLQWIKTEYRQRDDTPRLTVNPVFPGEPQADAEGANKGYVDRAQPTGMITAYGGLVAPTGWLLCDGGSYSETAESDLFAVIGRAFTDDAIPTGTFQVPDLQTAIAVGRLAGDDLLGEVGNEGGYRDAQLRQHNHILHPSSTLHSHTPPNVPPAIAKFTTNLDRYEGSTHSIKHEVQGTEVAVRYDTETETSGISGQTNDAGGGHVDRNYPPFVTVNYLIRK